jgi:hypothetical protein
MNDCALSGDINDCQIKRRKQHEAFMGGFGLASAWALYPF